MKKLLSGVRSALRTQEYMGERIGRVAFGRDNFCAQDAQGRKALIEAKKIAKLK